jgi:hypothetical protein
VVEQPESAQYKALAEECRSKAAECDREGELARDPTLKAAWLEMAKDWRALAAQIDAYRHAG